jgi:esterase/lipase superfamily enzyme
METLPYLYSTQLVLIACEIYEEEVIAEAALVAADIDPDTVYTLTHEVGTIKTEIKVKPSKDMVRPTYSMMLDIQVERIK